MNTERLAFRFTQNDRDNLVAIATGLRTTGRPFANKTDALRHALILAATAAARFVPVAVVDAVLPLDPAPTVQAEGRQNVRH